MCRMCSANTTSRPVLPDGSPSMPSGPVSRTKSAQDSPTHPKRARTNRTPRTVCPAQSTRDGRHSTTPTTQVRLKPAGRSRQQVVRVLPWAHLDRHLQSTMRMQVYPSTRWADRKVAPIGSSLSGRQRGSGDMAEQAPAGWYDDPYNLAYARWWDGVRWTQHVQELDAGPPKQVTSTHAHEATSSVLAGHHEPQATYQPVNEIGSSDDRRWWKRKRVFIPAGLVALVGMAGALGNDPEPQPIALTSGTETAQVDENLESNGEEPDHSPSTAASPTTSTTAALASSTTLSTSTASTTATTATTASPPSSTSPPPTEVSTTQTTAAQISTTATTPPPTTAAPTTATPTTAAPTTLADHVTPGAFCSPPGATGRTSTGKEMVCSLTNKDGEPYGEGRARWRSP